MMRVRNQLKKHDHRFAQTITGVDRGAKSWIVDSSQGALHPINHALPLWVGRAGTANGEPWIGQNRIQSFHWPAACWSRQDAAIASSILLNINLCTGYKPYQYINPATPMGSKIAVWRISERGHSLRR